MDEATTVHLYNLAHYSPFNALLSRHAVVLDENGYKNGLTMPAGFTHCTACGVVSVPGLTSSLRVKYSKTPRKSTRSRLLHISCLACHHTQVHNVLLNEKKLAPMPAAGRPAAGEKPKKRRKKSELATMLAQRKAQAEEKKPALSLFEFMQ